MTLDEKSDLVSEMQLLQFSYFVGISKCEEGSSEFEDWLTENKLHETYKKSSDSEKRLMEKKADTFYLNGLKTVLEKYSINLGINDMKEVIITDHYQQGFVFLAEASLAANDHIFKAMSESGDSISPPRILCISVWEFTTKCYQSYCEGEYDSGQLIGHNVENSTEEEKDLLIKAGAFPKNDLNIETIPVWRIIGDSLLRWENGHQAYDGMEVVFCYFAADEDGNENADINYKVFDIHVDSLEDGKTLRFNGGLENCIDLAKVDWAYMHQEYDDKKATESEDLTDDFENAVRQKFSEFKQ